MGMHQDHTFLNLLRRPWNTYYVHYDVYDYVRPIYVFICVTLIGIFPVKEINVLNPRFHVAVMLSDVTFVLSMYV